MLTDPIKSTVTDEPAPLGNPGPPRSPAVMWRRLLTWLRGHRVAAIAVGIALVVVLGGGATAITLSVSAQIEQAKAHSDWNTAAKSFRQGIADYTQAKRVAAAAVATAVETIKAIDSLVSVAAPFAGDSAIAPLNSVKVSAQTLIKGNNFADARPAATVEPTTLKAVKASTTQLKKLTAMQAVATKKVLAFADSVRAITSAKETATLADVVSQKASATVAASNHASAAVKKAAADAVVALAEAVKANTVTPSIFEAVIVQSNAVIADNAPKATDINGSWCDSTDSSSCFTVQFPKFVGDASTTMKTPTHGALDWWIYKEPDCWTVDASSSASIDGRILIYCPQGASSVAVKDLSHDPSVSYIAPAALDTSARERLYSYGVGNISLFLRK